MNKREEAVVPGGAVAKTWLKKIPPLHDAVDGYYHLYRDSVERYLRGEKPLASFTHERMTVSNMTRGGAYLLVLDGGLPAPCGYHMGCWDPDLKEVLGIGKRQYGKMTWHEKVLADTKVQAMKYAADEYEEMRDRFWRLGRFKIQKKEKR